MIDRLWMLKLTICEFLKRLTLNIQRRAHEIMLQFMKWFLMVTFVAVVIADIAECQPTTHYWQVVPDPGGKCRQGYAQLITMGTVNVITDMLLVVFPIPIIIRSNIGMKKKLQLTLLFAGSLLPAGFTLVRIPNIVDRDGRQQYRSLMASIEILLAAAVANALVLGSFVRDRGVKKQRWRFGSGKPPAQTASQRRTALTQWGSDEDLVRGIGLGVDPSLRQVPTNNPRPAPIAVLGNLPVKAHKQNSWQFPGERSDTSDDIDSMKISQEGPNDILTPRRISFFDVGGLLEEDRPRRISSSRTTDTDGESSMQGAQSNWSQSQTQSQEYGLSPPPPRRGSSALLQDIGGLLGPARSHRNRPDRGFELQTIMQEAPSQDTSSRPPLHLTRQQTTHSLQDVGGLLLPR